jgi:hypothetical protein
MKSMIRVASLVFLLAGVVPLRAQSQTFRDDFNGSVSSVWTITNMDSMKYSLVETPGSLTLHTTPTDVWSLHNDLVNLFTIPVPAGVNSFTVTTRIRFPVPPFSHPQQAGIVLLGDAGGVPDMDNYVRTTYGYIDGFRRLQRTHEVGGSPMYAYFGPFLDIGTNPIWIRMAMSGDSYVVYYSLDGSHFEVFDSFTAALPIAFIGLGAFHSEPYNQSIAVEYDYFEIQGVSVPCLPWDDDTMAPTGAIHAYPNVVPATDSLVTIILDGYIVDEFSIARDAAGIGVSAAYLAVDGKQIVLRAKGDTGAWNGKFRIPIKVLAKKGAVYKVILHGSDTWPAENGGPNSGIADATFIRVQ